MMLVMRQLAVSENVFRQRLSIVREIKDMEHVVLLLFHHFPTEVDDALQSERFMVFFPAMTD